MSAIEMLPIEEATRRVGRGPVPARPYFDPEWWELERKAIFLRSWIMVAHVCEVPDPGSFVRRDVEFARASLLVMRGRDGNVRAFHNVCTHRGTQLVEEAAGRRAQFSCPYHRWTFGSDGRLLSAPDFERFFVAKEDCSLRQVACEVVAGLVFVNFDREPAQTAREFLGAIADDLETLPMARAVDFTEWTYEIPANWKTNFDNFQENYHLRFIHPRTGEQAIGADNPFGYPIEYGFLGPHRSQTLWRNPQPPAIPPTIGMNYGRSAGLAQAEGLSFAKMDFKLFPCLHVVALPPGQQYTHAHYPIGPGRTRGVIRMYWTSPPDSASKAFTRELGAMAIRDVLSEDRLAVESGQRGLNSGAIEQIHLQDHEMLLRHLYETVQERVATYLAEAG